MSDDVEWVKLAGPGHCPVPRTFPASGHGRVGDHEASYEWKTLVTVNDEGTPEWDVLVISRPPKGKPIRSEHMERIDRRRILDTAVVAAIREYGDHDTYTPAQIEAMGTEAFLDDLEAWRESLYDRARTARRRRRITPDLLADVIRLYDEGDGGIAAVVDSLVCSERYAWKLLARARAEVAS